MTTTSKTKDNPANSLTYASMTPNDLKKLMDSLTAKEKAALLYDWHFWAREKQLPPKDFEYIVVIPKVYLIFGGSDDRRRSEQGSRHT